MLIHFEHFFQNLSFFRVSEYGNERNDIIFVYTYQFKEIPEGLNLCYKSKH